MNLTGSTSSARGAESNLLESFVSRLKAPENSFSPGVGDQVRTNREANAVRGRGDAQWTLVLPQQGRKGANEGLPVRREPLGDRGAPDPQGIGTCRVPNGMDHPDTAFFVEAELQMPESEVSGLAEVGVEESRESRSDLSNREHREVPGPGFVLWPRPRMNRKDHGSETLNLEAL